MNTPADDVYTVEDGAEVLKISRSHAYEMVKAGALRTSVLATVALPTVAHALTAGALALVTLEVQP